jgi:fumarate reductase flavoprotein subunit
MPTDSLLETDIAILGAGAAGMFVALAAQKRGLQVALIEPMAHTPNNLAISGGLFPAAGSALQRDAGVDDSPEAWLADLREFAPGMVNVQIAEAVAGALPSATALLVEQLGAPVHFLSDVPAPGHSQRRFHGVVPASGAGLHAWLRQACAAQPGIHWINQRAEAQRDAGGFELQTAETRIRASRLVLAGGGFGANAAMVARFIPGMVGALHNGSATQDGSVLSLGLAWGAQLWGMDGYQGQGHTNPGGHTRLGMSIPTLGGILVNRDGLRFVREDVGPSALAPWVLAQAGGLALEVFDAGIEANLGNHGAYQQAAQAGCVMTHDTLDGLAALAGVNAKGLKQSVAHAARCARELSPDDLGRKSFARPLVSPFKASWVTGALSHTQGGLLTRDDGAVLHTSGQVIPGVYAAGGCAAGLSGRGADGYLPGNGLAQAFGLGWRIAQALA